MTIRLGQWGYYTLAAYRALLFAKRRIAESAYFAACLRGLRKLRGFGESGYCTRSIALRLTRAARGAARTVRYSSARYKQVSPGGVLCAASAEVSLRVGRGRSVPLLPNKCVGAKCTKRCCRVQQRFARCAARCFVPRRRVAVAEPQGRCRGRLLLASVCRSPLYAL